MSEVLDTLILLMFVIGIPVTFGIINTYMIDVLKDVAVKRRKSNHAM